MTGEAVSPARLGEGVFGWLFVPCLLAFTLAPWWFSSAPNPAATALVLMLSLLFIWLAEQVYPRNAAWNTRLLRDGLPGLQRLGHDGVYLLAVAQFTAFLIAALDPPLRAAVASTGLGGASELWPASAPLWARTALAFFTIEFFSYWLHRAAHRSKLLWQFHSTHHFTTELNCLTSVRTHPVDSIFFFAGRLVPMFVLGAGAEEVVAATYVGGILGILAHANLRVSGRALGWVLNLPQTHAVHHSAALGEGNSNFGCHTVVFDRLFRTFRRLPLQPLVLGVQGVASRSLWQELAWPFYRRVR